MMMKLETFTFVRMNIWVLCHIQFLVVVDLMRICEYRVERTRTSLQRCLWELSANEDAAFRSATISKTSFGYIETGPWRVINHLPAFFKFHYMHFLVNIGRNASVVNIK